MKPSSSAAKRWPSTLSVPAFFDLCVAYSEAGRFEEARNVLTRMNELDRDPLRTDVIMARYFGMVGEREKAKRLLDKLLAKRGEQHVSPITLAVIYLGWVTSTTP